MKITGQCPLCVGPTRAAVLCAHCRRHLRQGHSPTDPLDPVVPVGASLITLGAFEGALRALVLRIKHSQDTRVAQWCGHQLARRSRGLPRPDAITYLPSQRVNRLKRGGDTAATVANALALNTGRPLHPMLSPPLGVHRRTRSGSERGKAQGFTLISQPVGRVWLVDDVLATGHSLRQAHDTLTAAGHRVEAWLVLARA